MDTFERKEIKYLLTPEQHDLFLQLVAGKVVDAEYPEGDISSMYYDTPEYLLINRSIQGGTYKEKLRVRSYGEVSSGSPVYVELKKKFKGVVYKRRVCCTLAAADAFLAGMDYLAAIERWPLDDALLQQECHSWKSQQIAGEIAWMCKSVGGVAPKMRVDVHRVSMVGADTPELRITLDHGASFRQAKGRHGLMPAQQLFSNGEIILEVKCSQALPMWLVQALDACGARPQSVSKYGRAYQAAMAPRLDRVA